MAKSINFKNTNNEQLLKMCHACAELLMLHIPIKQETLHNNLTTITF